MARELRPEEFDVRYQPIFEHVLESARYPFPFSPDTFFPAWRASMEAGVARTWASLSGRSVLGALFTPNLFTNQPGAFAIFWFTLGGDGRAPVMLLKAFEVAARRAGCKFAYASAYQALQGDRMRELYLHRGYEMAETVFRKTLG